VDSPASFGTHQLLRKGAKLVRHADDILEDLQSLPSLVEDKAPPQPQLPLNLDETQQKIWDALAERRMVDDLTQQLALPITELTRHLMMLELKKVVRRLPGNWYERF
jgi:DNA processing protein